MEGRTSGRYAPIGPPGALEGQGWIADDFDAPLDDLFDAPLEPPDESRR